MYRREHPELRQVVFRVGTILGETTRNQITALFDKPRLIALRGARSPFVFIWDQDVVGAIEHALRTGAAGIYNVAGDGALSIQEIASRLGKRCLTLPPSVLRAVLAMLHPLGLTRYGPEQVDFLRYRPVLDNRRLKEELGYVPRKTSSGSLRLLLPHARTRRGPGLMRRSFERRDRGGERRGRRARSRAGVAFRSRRRTHRRAGSRHRRGRCGRG